MPYDRIKISKSLDVDAEKILLRSAEFYRERNIELMMNTQLTELNPRGKLATLSNGQQIQYDKIFLATGSTYVNLIFIDDVVIIIIINIYDSCFQTEKTLHDR